MMSVNESKITLNVSRTGGFSSSFSGGIFEATIGFEPMNRGFADLSLKPLGYVAEINNEERETRLELATSTLARLRSTN